MKSTIVTRAIILLTLATAAACQKSEEAVPVTSRARALLPDETTPIGQKWRALMNAGINLGEATAPVQSTPGGAAQYQTFASFVIVFTNDHGAVYMPRAVFDKWLSLQSTPDANGVPVFSFFGVPMRDYVVIGDRSETTFTGGMIFLDSTAVARAVFGGIYLKYVTMAPLLGPPTSEEAVPFFDATARFQAFAGGEIYWSPGTNGAWAIVAGPILNGWRAWGSSELGLPLADSAALIGPNDAPIGLIGRFQFGSLYYNSQTGVTFTLDAPIATWYDRHGGPRGWLGWPLASSNTTPAGNKRFNDFEHGVLVWSTPGVAGLTRVATFGDLEFFLQRVEVTGEDCIAGICGPRDLYYDVEVISSLHGMIVDVRKPSSGDFGKNQDNHNAPLGPKMTANSALSIHARVRVFDADDPPPDEAAGTPSFTFDIDNLWGLQTDNVHETFDAKATFSIRSSHAFDENDFRGQKFWSFRNFSTPDLPYSKYAATFLDVDDGEAAPFNVFNAAYYDLFYKGVAEGGNCLAMDIEALYATFGRSQIGMPIHDAYDDTQNGSELVRANHPGLYDELNIKQGYQLGLEAIFWRVDRFLRGETHNPGAVFNDSKRFFDAGDLPLIAIYADDFGSFGHELVPYRWTAPHDCERLQGQCARILVADVNFPTQGAPPADDPQRSRPDDRFIEIQINESDPEAIEYSYIGAGPTGGQVTYQGGNWVGGRMYFEPLHTYWSMPVTPFYEPWVMATAAFLFIVGDAGKTLQITDGSGRTMFEPGLTGTPARWDQIRRDVNQRIPNLSPLLLGDQQPSRAQGWVGLGTGASHTYLVVPAAGTPAGAPMTAMFNSGALSSHFSIPATPGKEDRIAIDDINGPSKAIGLTLPADEVAKSVTWTIAGVDKQRWLEFSSLRMSPGQNIRMRLQNATRRVRITNNGPRTTANLRFSPGPGATPVNLGQVEIPFGESSIEPDGVGCLTDSACAAGEYCASGSCVARPCSLSAPFGGLVPVLPAGVNADGFALSADGKTAIVSNNPGGGGYFDLYVTSRGTTTDPFGPLTPITELNSWANDRAPWLSADGLRLYYWNSLLGDGSDDLVVASRASTTAPFAAPQLVHAVNSTADDTDPFFLPGEHVLFFASNRTGSRDLYTATRNSSGFTTPAALANVNSDDEDSHPVVTADGLTLYFRSRRPSPLVDSDGDIWFATRPSAADAFGTPQNLTAFNTTGSEMPVAISPDGCSLTFASNRETGLGGVDSYRLYRITRGQPQTIVTINLNIVGTGSVNTAPFACATGNSGTCSAQMTAGTRLTVWGNRPGYWSGTCAPNGQPGLSTDGVITVTTSDTCTVTFP